jgi:hypothetical protein
MKILAKDKEDKFIVEMTEAEIRIIAGRGVTQRYYGRDLIGHTFDVHAQWYNLEKTKLIISHLDVIRNSYQSALSAVENLKLERLKGLEEGD